MARLLLKQFTNTGISLDELLSVGLEALVKAIRKYNVKYKNKFCTYWEVICKNLMMKYIKENSYQYGAIMFNGLSLDSENQDNIEYSQLIGQDDEVLTGRHQDIDINRLIETKKLHLTKIQKSILKLYLDNKSTKEIAKSLGINHNSVYYHLTKAKEEIMKYLKKKAK